MNYLQDILAQAQQGQAIDNLARSYGISSEQAQQAVEAVLPAFAVGLQRSTQTPQSFAELLGTMSRNPYGQAFSDPSVGLGEDIRVQGNDALAAMFGSPDVSRAVAVQASAASGISSALLKQMLPAIAALVLGGLMKGGCGGRFGQCRRWRRWAWWRTGRSARQHPGRRWRGCRHAGPAAAPVRFGQSAARSARRHSRWRCPVARVPGRRCRSNVTSGSGNPLEDLLGGILGGGAPGGAGSGTQMPQQRPSGSGNPLEDLLGGILGGGAPQQRGAGPDQDAGLDPFGRGQAPSPGQARPGAGNDPLRDLLGGILGGMFGGGGPGGGAGGPAQGGGSAGGGTAQDPRLQQFQDIFDQFTDKNPRR